MNARTAPRTRSIVAAAALAFGLLAVMATVAEPTLLRFDQAVQAFILENRSVPAVIAEENRIDAFPAQRGATRRTVERDQVQRH